MKGSIFLVILAAAVVMLGTACGGGGGSSGNGNSASASASSSASASASASASSGSTGFTSDHIAGVLGGSGLGVGLTDVAAGEQVQLNVGARNADGQYVTLAGSNWSTSAPASVATVTSTGLLTAISASSTTYTLSGIGPNGLISTPLIVQAPQAGVTGVVRDANSVGIPYVLVLFYSSAGNFLTEAVTSANGSFHANVPPSAAKFTVNIELADPPVNGQTIFYREFDYGTASYLDGQTSCLTKLPAISVGTTTPLPNDIVLDAQISGPPPAPTGCLGG